MPGRVISEFPWGALERLSWNVESSLRRARRALERAGQPGGFAAALSKLLGARVELVVQSIDATEPRRTLVKLGFSARGAACTLGLEPALSAVLLAKLLRRPEAIVGAQTELDPSLLGALSALVLEAARQSGAEEPLLPCEVAKERAASPVIVHLTVLVDGRPYLAALWVQGLRALAEPPESLSEERLLGVELRLPLVVGVSAISVAELQALEPGSGFFPREGWLINRALEGRGILVAPTSEHGLGVELGPGSRIVLREPTSVAWTVADEMSESDDSREPTTLPQAVLEAPLVVRIEIGSVSMQAREWAALRPGDVLATGRRIGEPVVLRVGGRTLAKGELVDIDGELGVRVTEILGEGS